MTPSNIERPEDAPESLAIEIEESSDNQLREIIDYAQQLLRGRPPITEAIESRNGEELVRIKDEGAYTIVIVERPTKMNEARGPFAYRVKWEPYVDEKGGRYKWHYLGKVYDDDGGDRDE